MERTSLLSPLHTIVDPMVRAMPCGVTFENLLRQSENDLRAFLTALVRDSQRREELYQETARVLWTTFDRYDGSRAFGAWARGVARNVVQRHYRQASREGQVFSDAAVEAIEAAWEEADPVECRLAALEKCVAELPQECREAITRFYTGRERVNEIARSMGRSADAVYQLLSRSRARLAACVRLRLEKES